MRLLLMSVIVLTPFAGLAEAGIAPVYCTQTTCACGNNTCVCGEVCNPYTQQCLSSQAGYCAFDVECGASCGTFICEGNVCVPGSRDGGPDGGAGESNDGGDDGGSIGDAGLPRDGGTVGDGGQPPQDGGVDGGSVGGAGPDGGAAGDVVPRGCGCTSAGPFELVGVLTLVLAWYRATRSRAPWPRR